MAKLLFLFVIILLSSLWLYFLHKFAPNLSSDEDLKLQLKFPSNLKELQEVAAALQVYSVNNWGYVFLIFGSAYIYKQAFCLPGSFFLNLLAGALYGHVGGIVFACLFTAIGSTVCYLLSRTFAEALVCTYFPKAIKRFKEKVNASSDNLFYYMMFIRLFPIAPGWLINLTAPLVRIPIFIFFITTFFGLGPYNFVGVSAGTMLSSVKSINDVFTWKVFFNISIFAVVFIGYVYIYRRTSRQEKLKNS